MSSRLFASALAAAALCGGSGVLAQASGLDRNIPELPQYTAPPGPARADRQPEAPPRAGGRREQGHRDGNRAEPRHDHDARDGHPHQDADRRHPDRRHWDRRDWDRRTHPHRHYGYVAPWPFFAPAPPVVYYSPPPVYYGGVPQPYYPGYAVPQVFRPGDYLPPEFLGPQYVVIDWYWRGLSAPPPGYQWVLLAPDNYALVATGSGQIVSLVVTR